MLYRVHLASAEFKLTTLAATGLFSRTTACENTRLAGSVSSTGPQEALLLLRVF
jgi:hypothetical protein